MEYGCAFSSSLILTIAYSIFFCFEYRDRTYLLCAIIASLTLGLATALELATITASFRVAYLSNILAGLAVSTIFVATTMKIRRSNQSARKREKIRAQVEQSQKTAALGEVSSSIAHEIKNPLAALIYAVDLQKTFLQQTPLDMAQILKLTQNLEKTALQINNIINSLRDVSSTPLADPIKLVPLRQVIDQATDLFQMRLREANILLQVPHIVDGVSIECRETQICQLILNLLNNAFDAVTGTPNAWIQIETAEDIDAVTIAVTDSGLGVSPSLRDKLFKTNLTTKTKGKGTGLGLSICGAIVHQHHGTIELIQDSPHTRFEVKLPKFHTTRLK